MKKATRFIFGLLLFPLIVISLTWTIWEWSFHIKGKGKDFLLSHLDCLSFGLVKGLWL